MTSVFCGAEGKAEVATALRRAVQFILHHLLCVGAKGTVFSKQEGPDDGLLCLCNSLQVPKVLYPYN